MASRKKKPPFPKKVGPKQSSKLSPDRRIESEEEDELSFMSFADAASRSVTEMAPPEGLVVSIEAPWGSGKSSLIELIYRAIVRRALGQPTRIGAPGYMEWSAASSVWQTANTFRQFEVIRFNPWMVSGHENLIRALFTEIGLSIGHRSGKLESAVAGIRDKLPTIGSVFGGSAAA